jgi:hypothetical protein
MVRSALQNLQAAPNWIGSQLVSLCLSMEWWKFDNLPECQVFRGEEGPASFAFLWFSLCFQPNLIPLEQVSSCDVDM